MNSQLPGRSIALVLVIAFGLASVALASTVAVVLSRAPVFPVDPERRAAGCAWAFSYVPSGASEDTSAEPVCLHSIGGVELDSGSLVREPAYLEDRGAFDRWFEDQNALSRALGDLEEVTVEVSRAGGPRRPVILPIERSLFAHDWVRLMPFPLVGVALLFIGTFVYLRRPDLPTARTLFLFCHGIVITIWLTIPNTSTALCYDPGIAWAMYVVNIIGVAIIAATLLGLVGRFPIPQFPATVQRWFAPAVGVVSGAIVALDLAGVGYQLTILWLLLCAATAIVLMIRGAWRAQGQVQRLQVRWTAWGLAVPLIVFVIARLPTVLFPSPGADPTDTLVTLSAVTIPAGIGVAVLRYGLMNIEVVIRRTLVGAAVVTVFLFVYHLVIALFAGGLAGATGAYSSSFMAVFLTAVIFTFLLQPAQQALTGGLDRVFFRNRFHYRQLLGRLPNELSETREPVMAARIVLDQVCGSMEVPRMVVALAPDQERAGSWIRGQTEPPRDDEVWETLRAVGAPVLRDQNSLDDLHVWMRRSGLDLVLPLMVAEQVVGVMACAAPRGKRLFAADDVAALANVAAALALALSHALAFETIQLMNEELEQRVQDRTAELEQARLQLYQSEKMASVGLLAASVAHELNTPLGVVVSSSQRVAEALAQMGEQLQASTVKSARLCNQAAERAASIVQSLRDFSRPSQRDPEYVDLRHNIETTLQILEPTIARSDVEVACELADLPVVECFPALINQVIMNLLLNGLQAMDGRGTLSIAARAAGNDSVEIAVSDTGPGVPGDLRTRIFEPFFTTKGQGEGTGLGLSLSYNIIAAHCGTIEVDPFYTQGARFVVLLPRELPDEAFQGETTF